MMRFQPYLFLILMAFSELAVAATAPDTPAKAAVDSIYVQRVVITGNSAIPSKRLQALAAPYINRELIAAQIEALRELLTLQYTKRGYINSSVILDQEPAPQAGVLRFKVIEGHITNIRVRGLNRLRPGYVIDRLQASSQEIFNADILRERFQRLLDDPLFARLNSRILPGEQPGEALIEVDAQQSRPYALSVALNNYRPPAIGEKGYDAAGVVRDLTGWGDAVDADINGPTSGGPVSYSAGWQIPLNRYLTQLSLRSSYSNSVISEEPLEPIDIRSQIERQELKLIQPLWAARAQQLSFSAGVAYETEAASLTAPSLTMLPGAVPGETRAFVLRLAPDYSYRWEHQYLGLNLTLSHADMLDEPANTATSLQPDPHYWVSTGQLHYLWDLASAPFELETRATAQWTAARISDLHALPIGGVASVRGFREDELLLSNARNVNLDLRWLALAHASAAIPTLSCGTFFDWASGYDVGEPKTTLSSTGITLRAKWSHLQADLAVGIHLIHPGFVDQEHGSWQDHGIHAQIASNL
jgi:hemolysin activation/secretion protein